MIAGYRYPNPRVTAVWNLLAPALLVPGFTVCLGASWDDLRPAVGDSLPSFEYDTYDAATTGERSDDGCYPDSGLTNESGCGRADLCSPPVWSWQADALILWRSAPSNRSLISTIDPATSSFADTALNANQLQSDPLAAGRLALSRQDNWSRGLEVTYLWAGNFYSQRDLPPARNGYGTSQPGIYGNQFGPAATTSLDSAAATLIANLQTAEVNFLEPLFGDCLQFLIGFRWLQWNETLRIQDSYSFPPSPDPILLTGNDFYQTECFNNLYGGQIGLDGILYSSSSGLRLDGLIKAGAYYNDALQKSAYSLTAVDEELFSESNRTAAPDGASFVGEVGLTAVVPIHRNLDFRCGYFGLWVSGIAQPAGQLSGQQLSPGLPVAGTLDTDSGVVVQGVSFGLEGRW